MYHLAQFWRRGTPVSRFCGCQHRDKWFRNFATELLHNFGFVAVSTSSHAAMHNCSRNCNSACDIVCTARFSSSSSTRKTHTCICAATTSAATNWLAIFATSSSLDMVNFISKGATRHCILSGRYLESLASKMLIELQCIRVP